MTRVNVWIPDELAAEVKAADLNVSQVAQEALRRELRIRSFGAWLTELRALPPAQVSHEAVMAALDEVRDETGDFVEHGRD